MLTPEDKEDIKVYEGLGGQADSCHHILPLLHCILEVWHVLCGLACQTRALGRRQGFLMSTDSRH